MVGNQEQVVAFCRLCSCYTAFNLAFSGLIIRDVIADLIYCKGLVPITHDKVCFRTADARYADHSTMIVLATGRYLKSNSKMRWRTSQRKVRKKSKDTSTRTSLAELPISVGFVDTKMV